MIERGGERLPGHSGHAERVVRPDRSRSADLPSRNAFWLIAGEEDADAPSAVFSRNRAAHHRWGRHLRPGWAFAADKTTIALYKFRQAIMSSSPSKPLVLHVRLPRNALIVLARKSVRDVQVERRSAVEILSCAARARAMASASHRETGVRLSSRTSTTVSASSGV
jgi:hypothetical protein